MHHLMLCVQLISAKVVLLLSLFINFSKTISPQKECLYHLIRDINIFLIMKYQVGRITFF